jgi:hypothetical protein
MITTRMCKSAPVMLFVLGLLLAPGCSSPAGSDADADSQASSTESAPEPEVSITAVELADAYEADSSAADGKYKDKWLKVTGQLAGPPTTDAGGDRFIQFLQPDEDGKLWAETFVYLLPEEIEKLDELWRRQEMTIVGKCLGNPNTWPLLLECRIVATGEPIPVIEITAGDLIKQYQEDAKAADEKYEDKVLVISGVVVAKDSDEQVVDVAGSEDVGDDPMLVQINYTLSEDDLVAALKEYDPGDKIRFKADCGGKPGQNLIKMWYAKILPPDA